jgi:hypothetical protein
LPSRSGFEGTYQLRCTPGRTRTSAFPVLETGALPLSYRDLRGAEADRRQPRLKPPLRLSESGRFRTDIHPSLGRAAFPGYLLSVATRGLLLPVFSARRFVVTGTTVLCFRLMNTVDAHEIDFDDAIAIQAFRHAVVIERAILVTVHQWLTGQFGFGPRNHPRSPGVQVQIHPDGCGFFPGLAGFNFLGCDFLLFGSFDMTRLYHAIRIRSILRPRTSLRRLRR